MLLVYNRGRLNNYAAFWHAQYGLTRPVLGDHFAQGPHETIARITRKHEFGIFISQCEACENSAIWWIESARQGFSLAAG